MVLQQLLEQLLVLLGEVHVGVVPGVVLELAVAVDEVVVLHLVLVSSVDGETVIINTGECDGIDVLFVCTEMCFFRIFILHALFHLRVYKDIEDLNLNYLSIRTQSQRYARPPRTLGRE